MFLQYYSGNILQIQFHATISFELMFTIHLIIDFDVMIEINIEIKPAKFAFTYKINTLLEFNFFHIGLMSP